MAKHFIIHECDIGSEAYTDQYVLGLEAKNERLQRAIVDSDEWAELYCVVCQCHRPNHSKDCPMRDQERVL